MTAEELRSDNRFLIEQLKEALGENKRKRFKRVAADISSNNKPVWELYETFGYKASNPHYVFVKHNLL